MLRSAGWCAWLLLPLVILISLAVGLGYVRLLHGPISLGFLTGPIERGITAELAGLEADIDDAIVVLNEDGGLQFRLRNVRISEPDGDVVASAPLAAVELSTSALFGMRLAPSRIELIDPQLFLFYSDSSGLALSFSRPQPESAESSASAPRVAQPATKQAPVELPQPTPRRIDLAKALSEASAKMRNGAATSELKQVGLRNARVRLDNSGRTSEWSVPEVAIDLHQGNISGEATIASIRGPWSLSFRTEDSEKTQQVALKATVRDLVPRSIVDAVPQLPALQSLDMPVSADSAIELTSDGEIDSAQIVVRLGRGKLLMPADPNAAMLLDAGEFNLGYERGVGKIVLQPSKIEWGESHAVLAGAFSAETSSPDGRHGWNFDIKATEGLLAAEEFGVPGLPVETWSATGRFVPEDSLIQLSRLLLKAGGSDVVVAGDVDVGRTGARTRIDGKVGPMSMYTLAAVWPRVLAPGARNWVGKRVLRGQLKGGTLSYVGAESGKRSAGGTEAAGFNVAMEAEGLRITAATGMAPIEAPRASIRVKDGALEVTVPDAEIVADPTRRVPLKGGRFASVNITADWPVGDISFRVQSQLAPVLDVLDSPPLDLFDLPDGSSGQIDGKVDGQFKVTLPLIADLDPASLTIVGTAAVTEGKAKQLFGSYSVQGAKITVDVTGKAVDAKGEMLLNGVLAKVNWQRIFDAPGDKQPPLRLTANLDNSDRLQLGLDVNHLVEGEVATDVTIVRKPDVAPEIHIRADLTNATLVSETMGWRKPPGRSAFLECDVVEGRVHKTELQNFKIAGDDIAVEGWIAIGADNKVREFAFPDVSLNVVTRLNVQGVLGNDNVWKIAAKGPTFDGREFFRSLFSVGQSAEAQVKQQKPGAGADVEADIDTVIGFFETNLRNVKVKASKRSDKLTVLDARGTLDGGKPLAAVFQPAQGDQQRKLLADSTDAGQAMRLIGFYPNLQGGRVRLEVNLDGTGPAEKTGTLWVEEFKILGDPVASEVFGGADSQPSQGAGQQGKRRVVRQVFEFDKMRVPFSVGYGQFVLENSYLRGPVLGATIRGKVDYKTQTVNLAGTYIPLQGLNNMFVGVPLLGELLSGPNKEGIFGITFAVQGPMAKPQVVVNPFSLVAPGIFREMFQMGSLNPKVQAPAASKSKAPVEKRLKVPGTPAAAEAVPGAKGVPKTVDGWSSQTSAPTAKN